MSKVTSKRQVTLPKGLADAYGIAPGDEIDWEPAGDAIRVVLRGRAVPGLGTDERLALFDGASRRHRERWEGTILPEPPPPQRGWTRDELYDRGRSG